MPRARAEEGGRALLRQLYSEGWLAWRWHCQESVGGQCWHGCACRAGSKASRGPKGWQAPACPWSKAGGRGAQQSWQHHSRAGGASLHLAGALKWWKWSWSPLSPDFPVLQSPCVPETQLYVHGRAEGTQARL